jgi:hypothetical protein
MKGGVYDPATETIVAPGGSFELYAILTPQNNAKPAEIAALLADTYYVSVALTPQLNTAASLGSFDFGLKGTTPTTVDVTADMTYGVPPVELFAATQGQDPGDLAKHGIYPTYFAQFEVHFTAANTTLAYNTATNPGGLTPDPTGTAYYATFTGNSTLLAAGYNLHFDLYSTEVLNCGKKGFPLCKDVDINKFAPFSHDAETTDRVPEPLRAHHRNHGTRSLGTNPLFVDSWQSRNLKALRQ